MIITVIAGKGGNGSSSFHREKYKPKGGPDGGNGGKGGDVIIVSDRNVKSLREFKLKKIFVAENGGNGKRNNKHGADGQDKIIKVPVGTVVKDVKTGDVLSDLKVDNQAFTAAKGGAGGKGNTVFKSSVNQTPTYSELGIKGEEKKIELDLKLFADVGIIGMPNAGKSTLLSRLTNASPKIGKYPFTTLEPQFGQAYPDEIRSILFAEIPGLIEGAHLGKGIGDEFLRHSERAMMFVHLVDITGEDPLKDVEIINNELEKYKKELMKKKQIIVFNKMDISGGFEDRYLKFKNRLEKKYRVIGISALKGSNIKELLELVWNELEELKKENLSDDSVVIIKRYELSEREKVKVKKIGKNIFRVHGKELEVEVEKINFNSEEGLEKLRFNMEKYDVYRLLKKYKVKQGDTVFIGDRELEYFEDDF